MPASELSKERTNVRGNYIGQPLVSSGRSYQLSLEASLPGWQVDLGRERLGCYLRPGRTQRHGEGRGAALVCGLRIERGASQLYRSIRQMVGEMGPEHRCRACAAAQQERKPD